MENDVKERDTEIGSNAHPINWDKNKQKFLRHSYNFLFIINIYN